MQPITALNLRREDCIIILVRIKLKKFSYHLVKILEPYCGRIKEDSGVYQSLSRQKTAKR